MIFFQFPKHHEYCFLDPLEHNFSLENAGKAKKRIMDLRLFNIQPSSNHKAKSGSVNGRYC